MLGKDVTEDNVYSSSAQARESCCSCFLTFCNTLLPPLASVAQGVRFPVRAHVRVWGLLSRGLVRIKK